MDRCVPPLRGYTALSRPTELLRRHRPRWHVTRHGPPPSDRRKPEDAHASHAGQASTDGDSGAAVPVLAQPTTQFPLQELESISEFLLAAGRLTWPRCTLAMFVLTLHHAKRVVATTLPCPCGPWHRCCKRRPSQVVRAPLFCPCFEETIEMIVILLDRIDRTNALHAQKAGCVAGAPTHAAASLALLDVAKASTTLVRLRTVSRLQLYSFSWAPLS